MPKNTPKVKVKSLSCVQVFVTPWTVAYQTPLSMGFSRQEYWSGVPLPSLIRSAEGIKQEEPKQTHTKTYHKKNGKS